MTGPYSGLHGRLSNGRVLLDAPVGAELVRRGVRWRKHGLLTNAQDVRCAHVDYLRAGAQVLRTDTFGLNRRTYLNVFRSPEHMAQIGAPGLETLAPRLLRRAVEVARQARDDAGRPDVPIAGLMSPLEHVFRPDLAPGGVEALQEHEEIARTLAEAGVDLLLLEAFGTTREARAALEAARATGLPLWISYAVDERGDLLGDEAIGEAARFSEAANVDALFMTAAPLADVELAWSRVRGALGIPGGFAPMWGRFEPPSWKFEFHPQFSLAPPPGELAAGLKAWTDTGANIVGAWCGATPEHVEALGAAMALWETE